MGRKKYIPFGPEWEKEMMKFPKEELVLMIKVQLKAINVKTLDDAQRFVDGVLNDFESGLMNREETMNAFLKYTLTLQEMFWKNAKEKIRNDPELLNT